MLKKIHGYIFKNANNLAILIIVTALILMTTSVWNDAPIVDEIPHIGAGYSYIAKGDHRLNPEHPPLAKDLAGLGVALTGPTDKAFYTEYWNEDINGQWDFGRYLIFNSDSDTESIVKMAKFPVFIFFILTGVLVFIWTSKLYGKSSGLLALFLFSFSPTILAHSRFVTTDIPALFGVMVSSYFFIRYLKNPTLKNFIIAGLAFGLAQLTKYSLVLLGPFFLIVGFAFGFVNPSGNSFKARLAKAFDYSFSTIIIMVVGFLVVVWPYYIPHIWNEPPSTQHEQTETILQSFGRRELADPVVYFSDKPVIRALAQYGLGLLMVIQRSVGGNDTYFMGEFSNQAWKSYFPLVYLLKEPLAFWLLILGIWIFYSAKWKPPASLKIQRIWSWKLNWIKEHFTEFAMLLWLVVYWTTSIRANLNIGVRHLLPVYGFTIILMSGRTTAILKSLAANRKNFIASISVVVALLTWYLVENIRVFPHYLTYFNQLAGGPSGGSRYVVDSNVDWGQDVKRLNDWVKENNVQKIHLDYFGWSDQTYYLRDRMVWIGSERFRSKKDFLAENPQGGYIAVSATFYMGLSLKPGQDYLWLPLEERLTTIGNSIFVWHITP